MQFADVGAILICIVGAFYAHQVLIGRQLLWQRIFWFGLALFFLLLAADKQFHLLSWVTASARTVAWEHSWYSDRRGIQYRFILLIFAAISASLFLAIWIIRKSPRHYWLILISAGTLLGFTLVRSISIHEIDVILNETYAGIQLNSILEISLIVIVVRTSLAVIGAGDSES